MRSRLIPILFTLGTALATAVFAADSQQPAAQYTKPSGDTRLADAAENGDFAGVVTLLKAKVPANQTQPDGSTALLWAARSGSLEMVRALLAAGAQVNAANRYGLTPLMEACREDNAAIAEALLAAGADPSLAQSEGETPLMAASAVGNLRIVQKLISMGVDVNAKEKVQDQNALMWAADAGHADVVQALLNAKANPNAIARPSSLQRVGSLDGGRMWVDHSSGGLSTLMFAARQGSLESVRELVKAGADMKYANPDKITALMIAVVNDHLDLAAELLKLGADPNDGSLYEAVQIHNLRMNSTAGDATRPRPIHENSLTPSDLIGRFLDAGADPLKPAEHTLHSDGTGTPRPVDQSAMTLVLNTHDVEVLRVLLAKGLSANKPLENGNPPLVAALTAGGGGFFGFGVTPAAYRYPGSHSIDETLKLLVDSGADVKGVSTATGDTALHAAAQSGNLNAIRFLAERGASLTAQNKFGFTPLDIAMGKRPPNSDRRRGGNGGFPPRRDGPQPEAIKLLRELMGLPAEAAPSASSASANPLPPAGNN